MITALPLRIVVLAPFVTRSSDSGDVGIDLPLARTADGKVMIPGTHVIGKLAAAMRELASLTDGDPVSIAFQRDLVELLGSREGIATPEEDRASDGREARRALIASDFVLETAAGSPRARTRIAIDNVHSTVLDGMMQVVEQPFATGQRLVFRGHLRIVGKLDDERSTRILKALQFVTQMGALRTIGYGQLVEIALETTEEAVATPEGTLTGPNIVARLRFEDVFCVGEARNSPNTYTSADHVPGGVIKGAIARQMLASAGKTGFLDNPANAGAFEGDLAVLARDFGKMRVRHAQPVLRSMQMRPYRAIPDSLAVIDGDDGRPVIVDLAGLDDPNSPVLLNGKVPVAPFDWKENHWTAARALLGVADAPARLLRVRTQVADDTRAAMTTRLFGIEYTRGDCHDFLAEIDLSDCPEAPAMIRGLRQVIENGLAGIGRGGAFADVLLEKPATAAKPLAGKRVVGVLQSAALLRDPSRAAVDLHTAYADAFAELGLPETIRLTAVFVRERLAGGGFFRSRLAQSERAYAPWLLTEAGATFVFDSVDGSDIDPAGVFPAGLPVPQTVLIHHGIEDLTELYRVCPYLPDNGYGDLVVDPFPVDGRPHWQARSPAKLGLSVEQIGALSLMLES